MFNLKCTIMTDKQKVINALVKLPDDVSFEKIEDEVYELSPNKIWKNKKRYRFYIFTGFFAVFSLIVLLENMEPVIRDNDNKVKVIEWGDAIVYSMWLLGPPLWFLFEYICDFEDKYKARSVQQTDFKFTYELASKVWAALLILFGLILYVHYGQKI